MQLKVAVIGECMIEFQQTDLHTFTQSFGGDSLNTAIYLRRLIADHLNPKVSYVTGLGNDQFSKQMLESWQSNKIDTSLVYTIDNKIPGLYTIKVDDQGERTFNYWRNDAAAKYWLNDLTIEQIVDQLKNFNLIYLSGISLAILPITSRQKLIDALTLVKQQYNIQIAFDNNYRPILWESVQATQEWYSKILQITDLAFLTFDDEQKLWQDQEEQQAIARSQALGVKEIVLKHGHNPATVVNQDGYISVAGIKVDKVVDTTAAGDSFSAAYLAKRLVGASPQEAVYHGHQLASTVIQHRGAIIPLIKMSHLI